ncbi:MAG: thymidine phosphorylase, partial [Bdellovibrionales bacterium]|nr:thymidine phosphorylase [Bdellovibrionales bacterium]
IGKGYGIETQALITDMSQPLGHFVGNSLEVGECISILKREDFLGHSYKDFHDTETLSLELSAHMVSIGKKISLEQARTKCLEVLDNGKAFEAFDKICKAQQGDLAKLPITQNTHEFVAEESGFMTDYNTEKIGLASIALGAGRKQLTDIIQPECGLKVHKKWGDKVDKGEPLFTLYADSSSKGVEESKALLTQSFQITQEPVESEKLILLKL